MKLKDFNLSYLESWDLILLCDIDYCSLNKIIVDQFFL